MPETVKQPHPVIRVDRVRGVRVRSQHAVRSVEVDVGGHIADLGPVATRALITRLQSALANAEGRAA